MVYGLIHGAKDGSEVRALYRGKKIREENQLVSMEVIARFPYALKAGDVVYCVNVDYFASIAYLHDFCSKAVQRGAAVHFLAQPYLDVGNGKHWKNTVQQDTCCRMRLEREWIAYLFSRIALHDQGKRFVASCISAMNIQMVAKTYSSDGILKRGT